MSATPTPFGKNRSILGDRTLIATRNIINAAIPASLLPASSKIAYYVARHARRANYVNLTGNRTVSRVTVQLISSEQTMH